MDNCIWRKSPKLRRRQFVQKRFCLPYFEIPKDIATKNGQTHVWGRSVPSGNLSRRSAQDICPRAKKYILFHYRGLPWELPSHVHVIHFWKTLVEPMVRHIWHVTLRLNCLEDIRGQNLEFWGPVEVPPREDFMPGSHLPSCKISRRSVYRRRDIICNQTNRWKDGQIQICNHNRLISVAFVDNNYRNYINSTLYFTVASTVAVHVCSILTVRDMREWLSCNHSPHSHAYRTIELPFPLDYSLRFSMVGNGNGNKMGMILFPFPPLGNLRL